MNEFEKDAMQRTRQRQETVSELREHAFALICAVSTTCLACVAMLYILIRRDIRRKYLYRQKLEASDHRNRELLAAS